MKLQKQLHRHDPDNGIYGDCLRAVVASMLGLDVEDVPHEHRQMTMDESCQLLDKWLLKQGVHRIGVGLVASSVEDALTMGSAWSNGVPYMFTGSSKNGTNHVVIAQGDKIIHDPALDDSGIVGPNDVGQYIVEWLIRRAD